MPPDALPTAGISQVRDGDIVFRRGKDVVSDVVRGLDPHPTYSHVGIVVLDGSEPMVVHAVPAESKEERDSVKFEALNRFLAADRATAMALYRLREVPGDISMSASRTAAREALRLAQAKAPFDNAFDLDTPDRLYCTELVWYVFRKAGIDLVPDPPSKRFLLWSGRYIPPSVLEASPLIERVCC